MKNYKNILLAVLAGISIYSVYKYSVSLKEKYDLMSTIEKTKGHVEALKSEKQILLQDVAKQKELQKALVQENSELNGILKANQERLEKVVADFKVAKAKIEQLNSYVSALKAESTSLIKQRENLSDDVTRITAEKENLQARLSSLEELKKAIRELKRNMSKFNTVIKQKAKPGKIEEGNSGFLVKNGRSTFPARVRIKVTPVAP